MTCLADGKERLIAAYNEPRAFTFESLSATAYIDDTNHTAASAPPAPQVYNMRFVPSNTLSIT